MWEQPTISGIVPEARAGHTFTYIGGRNLLFGGCGRKDGSTMSYFPKPSCFVVLGKAQAFNDLYELAPQGEDGFTWKTVPIDSHLSPLPRARHVAVSV